MFLKIYRYLLGYVRFVVSGDYPERLLNLLSVHSITAWNILRCGGGVEANVLIKDYKKIRVVRRQSGCRVHCRARFGAPFFAKKYQKRMGAAIGALLFALLLWFFSSRVWNIEIKGNRKTEDAVILSACRDIGIFEGASRRSIDPKQARLKLALALPDIAWASVNIEGSVVTVEISETKTVEKEESEAPSNLKAAKDGVIKAIEVTQGAVAVRVGDGVVKGDMLVSGVMEYADGSSAFVPSRGRIMAETKCEMEYFAPFAQTKEVLAKEPVVKRVLHLFSLKIPLYIGSVQGDYERVIEEKRIEFGSRYAPVYITEGRFYKKTKVDYTLDAEGALAFAQAELEKREKSELQEQEIEILDIAEESEVRSDGVWVKRTYTCLENIAKSENLIIGTTNS